ncbi:hypothetical protein ACH4FX_03110 [Streptomyces sp. NPDC018019]|uniref:hypothetical protein n=1 Tax=Streptomyces sp. NPDC018019 TaxID=3365030 RepID=UPI0037938549
MDMYRPANPRSRGAAHYRRPGTSASYCGRTLEANPTEEKYVTGVCQVCAKAEKRDRVAAEQTATNHSTAAPALRERANVRYALVGKGRRVHYSPNNDETLCGRPVSEYREPQDVDLSGRLDGLCAPCVRAAEERAYARALAATSPLAAAAVKVAEIVEQAEGAPDQAAEQSGPSVTDIVAAIRTSGEHLPHIMTRLHSPLFGEAVAMWAHPMSSEEAAATDWEQVRTALLAPADEQHTSADAREQQATDEPSDTWTIMTRNEEEIARVEGATVEDMTRAAEALPEVQANIRREGGFARRRLYRSELRPADIERASHASWRDEWIGEQAANGTLFDITPATEQGALFAPESAA